MKFFKEHFNTLFYKFVTILIFSLTSNAQRPPLDCYTVKGTTLKLEDTHIDKYLSVNSVEDCKKACEKTFINCKSFSYKDDSSGGIQDANCLLSRENSQTLNTRDSRDFNYNDKYTFYERSNSIDCDQKENQIDNRKENYNRDRDDNFHPHIHDNININKDTRDSHDNHKSNRDDDRNRHENYVPNRIEPFNPDRNDNFNPSRIEDANPDRRRPPLLPPLSHLPNPHHHHDHDHVRKDYNSDVGDECFKRLATGKRVVSRLVEFKLNTLTKQECEDECLRATFVCRGFNYRYATVSSAQSFENCELSPQDSYGVDIEDTFIFARDMDFDYYERTGFGRQCDGTGPRRSGESKYSTLDSVNRYNAEDRKFVSDKYNENRYNDRYGTRSRYGPSNTYQTAVRYNPVTTYNPKDRYYSGGSGVRYNDGYRYGSKYRYPNYESYGYGQNRDCFRFYQKETRLDARAIRERLQVRDLNECKEECRISRNFVCRTISYSYAEYSSSWFGKDNCYLSDLRVSTLDQYDLIYDRSFDIYVLEEYGGRDCNFYGGGIGGGGLGGGLGGLGGGGFYPYDDPYDEYGREDRFETVSGLPCYRGGCRLDRLGKYFFCETDPTGGWDYCCRPNEYCDYSAGYPLKWCYVGILGNDQWRPCNMNSVGLRAYLKEGDPDKTLLLEDPRNSTKDPKDLEMDRPIEVEEITDLAGVARN